MLGPTTGIFYSGTLAARVKRKMNSVGHAFYLDNAPDHTRSVLISGVGRSGTTWLADVLNYANEYRLVYEPFNHEQVPLCKHFLTCQYLRPHDNDPRYLKPARAIFSGRVRNAFVDQYNRRVFATRRLIKDVRSALMLKWIREHFPGMPIIFMVRHPCAVAISKVHLGWGRKLSLKHVFLDQADLTADYLAPFATEIRDASTVFEKYIVAWCVETLVPLAQLNVGDVYLAFYENLCANPAVELQRLFEFLGKPFDHAALSRIRKPSATSRDRGDLSAVMSGRNVIEDWRRLVSEAELSTARRIISKFGLDHIYGDESIPNVDNARGLLANLRAANV